MKRGLRVVLAVCGLASLPALAQEPDKDKMIATGAKIYDLNCAPCHGDKLANPGITFDLKRLKANEKPRFLNSALNGKNQMPPWKGVIKESDLETIWEYIRANAYERD